MKYVVVQNHTEDLTLWFVITELQFNYHVQNMVVIFKSKVQIKN